METSTLSIDARMLFSSGVGTYLQNLLKRIRFEPLGVKVCIFAYDLQGADWLRQYQPEAEVKINPHWIYGVKEQLYWMKHLDGKGAFWSPHFNIPWGGYEKLIVTVHDVFGLTGQAPLPLRIYANLMFGRTHRQADTVLTVSEFTRHELESRLHFLGEAIHVISNGVDPHWFTPTLPTRPYPFNYLVYVGNLKPHKNVKGLLKAFLKVAPTQKLVVVGNFKTLKYRDNETAELIKKAGDRVISTDHVDDEKLRAIVKHSDGLILPSFYEGFGLPPLEAMASRVPVLVSDSSSLPEVCGSSAFYCNPYSDDSIAEGLGKLLALEGIDRKKRIEAGYEHAATFNWDKSAASTLEVFKSALT